MKISYAITVCDELHEVRRLLDLLHKHKREQDEIIVLLDKTKSSTRIENMVANDYNISLHVDFFNGHFADWKNKLNSFCTGDYIFQIDADEYPHEDLIADLPEILESNPTVELYIVPRVNTVEGITPEHIATWGWNVNNKGWINFPDYQWRIYKNSPYIKWKNKVHEIIEGHKTMAQLPAHEYLSLYHPKTIQRQELQNNYYATL